MGLHKHHPTNIRQRTEAMIRRWEKDEAVLIELGFRYDDEGGPCDTLRNLQSAIAQLQTIRGMDDSALNHVLSEGRHAYEIEATSTRQSQTAYALFGPADNPFCYQPDYCRENVPQDYNNPAGCKDCDRVIEEVSAATEYKTVPCGGCGETNPMNRCINCFHEF